MMVGQFGNLPGLNGYPGVGVGLGVGVGAQQQLNYPAPVQGLRGVVGTGPGTPPYPLYQPQPQAQVYPGYDYGHGHVLGQPYPTYWNEHERQNHQGSAASVAAAAAAGYQLSSSMQAQSQFGVPVVPRMQLPLQPPTQALPRQAVEQHAMSPQPQYHQLQPQQPPLMFGQVEGEAPPPTMLARPSSPEESEVTPVTLDSDGVEGQEKGQGQTEFLEARGRTVGQVIFGSIGLPGADHSPSPMMRPDTGVRGV